MKKEQVIALIREIYFNSEMDKVIENFTDLSAKMNQKDVNVKKLALEISQEVRQDAFLGQYTSPYEETFSEDELKFLLDMYRSPIYKKLSDSKFAKPLMEGLRLKVEEMLKNQ